MGTHIGSVLVPVTFFAVFAIMFISQACSQCPTEKTEYTNQLSGEGQTSGSRILNGEDADIADYPFYGLIVKKKRLYLNLTNHTNVNVRCGSSLISPKYFLTAFHCFMNSMNPKDWVVIMNLKDRCGTLGDAKIYNIVKVIPHPHVVIAYKTKKNDIAIVKVNREVIGIPPIDLPISAPRTGELGVIIGFGLTKINTPEGCMRDLACPLQKVTQLYPEQNKCIEPKEIIVGAFCAMDAVVKDAASCRGDSGGPWITNRNGIFTISGVSSFGDTLCQVTKHSDHYTDVMLYVPWIKRVISKSPKSKRKHRTKSKVRRRHKSKRRRGIWAWNRALLQY